jgi:sialic acid synthase SpsE
MAVRFFDAALLEKHFKIDADMPTPDSEHSLAPVGFMQMISLIKGKDAYHLGADYASQKDFYHKHNRRLVATMDIAPGDVLRYGVNFGAYRTKISTIGALSGLLTHRINGKVAAEAISKGSAIYVADL